MFQILNFAFLMWTFHSIQSLSRVQLFATPCITAHQASLSITNSRSSPRLTSIESVMPSSHLILCRPLLLLPPVPLNIKVLRVPSTARRSNQAILKEISPGISLEGMMLKLKLQYFGHLMRRVDSLEKISDAGRDWGQEEKGTTEDEMAGWHHGLNGRESV